MGGEKRIWTFNNNYIKSIKKSAQLDKHHSYLMKNLFKDWLCSFRRGSGLIINVRV